MSGIAAKGLEQDHWLKMARDLAVKGDALGLRCFAPPAGAEFEPAKFRRLSPDGRSGRGDAFGFRVDLAAAVGGLEPEIVGRPAGVDADSDGVWRSGHRLQRAG